MSEEKDRLARIPEGEALEKALEQAYRVYQKNIRAVDEAVYNITRGARGDVPEGELLEMALQALEKCCYTVDEE